MQITLSLNVREQIKGAQQPVRMIIYLKACKRQQKKWWVERYPNRNKPFKISTTNSDSHTTFNIQNAHDPVTFPKCPKKKIYQHNRSTSSSNDTSIKKNQKIPSCLRLSRMATMTSIPLPSSSSSLHLNTYSSLPTLFPKHTRDHSPCCFRSSRLRLASKTVPRGLRIRNAATKPAKSPGTSHLCCILSRLCCFDMFN
jgi:hypothetical protein